MGGSGKSAGKGGKGGKGGQEGKGGGKSQKGKDKDKGGGGGGGGKGKGKGAKGGKEERPGTAKSWDGEIAKEAKEEAAKVVAGAAEEEGEVDGGSSSTRALVEALRAFSTPQWWLIGQRNAEEIAAAPRRRAKPEEFRKICEERHAEMRK
ncbi:unnamed protein product, partial [Polarella glacialis]